MTAAPAGEPATALVPTWTFADRMRKIRRDVLDMEQAELAAELGVTKAAYAAWESGRNEPRSILALAKKVELISRVPASWLLGVDSPTIATDASTRWYGSASSPRSATLTLVSDTDEDNPVVALPYGSSGPHGEYADDRRVTRSAGTVNDANAA